MEVNPKIINNVSGITEKKEAVKIITDKKEDLSIDNIKSKNSQNFKKHRRFNIKLRFIESIIAK